MDFERFARKLCEREICPNLVPTTGPTGGGDSKVDSETYPVADQISDTWLSGFNRDAAKERWAFAVSAKAQWQPKLKSDVEKIIETERDYKKIFFITNQLIPAKSRSKIEDSLTKLHGVEVRVLDGTWILDHVFTGQHFDLVFDELRVSGRHQDTQQIGSLDRKRTARLSELESRISVALNDNRRTFVLVDDAIESAELTRGLEKARGEVEGSFGRADRFALETGTLRQQVETAYQWAWTLFWWFNDFEGMASQYQIVEKRAKDSANVYDLERLWNLWQLLSTAIQAGNISSKSVEWLEDRTSILIQSLDRIAADKNRPSTSLQARAMKLFAILKERLDSDEDPKEELDGLLEVAREANNLIGYPFERMVRLIEVFGQVIGEHPSYEALFGEIVDMYARREGEVSAATLILKRGTQLLEMNKVVPAIAMIGQVLGRLYKYETRRDLAVALCMCSTAYERVGLLWAARGALLSAASIESNEHWNQGEITRLLMHTVNRIKWKELMLGRFPQVLEWHECDLLLRQARRDIGDEVDRLDEEDIAFDALLSRTLMRTPLECLAKLTAIPASLERLGLEGSRAVLCFLLGHEDELAKLSPDDSVQDIAQNIWNLDADVPLAKTLSVNCGELVTMSSIVMGCQIESSCIDTGLCLEVAESILAMLESFVATSIIETAFANEPTLRIEVTESNQREFVEHEVEYELGRPVIRVTCRQITTKDITPKNQIELREQVFRAAITALCHVVQFPDHSTLEQLFRVERVSERAASFTGSVGTIRNILGDEPRFKLTDWVQEEDVEFEIKRTEPWMPNVKEEPEASPVRRGLTPGEGEPPPGLFPDNLRHDQMQVVSPIRSVLWEKAGWSGAFYLTAEGHVAPAQMGLVFSDPAAGKEIFSGWAKDFGSDDTDRLLRISIIRGIDTERPHAYRIVVGMNPTGEAGQMNMMVARVNTMNATTPLNLGRFVEAFERHGEFYLRGCAMVDGEPVPISNDVIRIHELNVRDAWQIGVNDLDLIGVNDDDKIVIPPGETIIPALRLQQWKRSRGRRG